MNGINEELQQEVMKYMKGIRYKIKGSLYYKNCKGVEVRYAKQQRLANVYPEMK